MDELLCAPGHVMGLLHGELIDLQNPYQWLTFVAVLSFGFFSSWHCTFMCVPLVIPVVTGTRGALFRILLYNLGRVASYAALGAILGLGGHVLGRSTEMMGKLLSFFASAICLIASLKFLAPSAYPRLVSRLRSLIRAMRIPYIPFNGLFVRWPISATRKAIGLGLITGLLPCMTLSPIYSMAVASGRASSGAIMMIFFFLGTLPVMTVAPAMPGVLRFSRNLAKLRIIAGLFLIFAAWVTLARALRA